MKIYKDNNKTISVALLLFCAASSLMAILYLLYRGDYLGLAMEKSKSYRVSVAASLISICFMIAFVYLNSLWYLLVVPSKGGEWMLALRTNRKKAIILVASMALSFFISALFLYGADAAIFVTNIVIGEVLSTFMFSFAIIFLIVAVTLAWILRRRPT